MTGARRVRVAGAGALLGAAALSCSAPAPKPAYAAAEPVLLRDTSGDRPDPANYDVWLAPLEPADARWSPKIVGAEPAPAPSRAGRIDLDVRGADIHDVCRLLADVGHANIVVGDGVQGTVSVRMRGVPWDEALRAIAEAKGFRLVRQGDVILVMPSGRP